MTHIERGHWKRLFREISLMRVIEESSAPAKTKYLEQVQINIQRHWWDLRRVQEMDP